MKYSNSIFFFFKLSISDPLPNGSSQQNEQELTRTFIIPLLVKRNNSVSSKPF